MSYMKISFQVMTFASAPDDSEVPKDPQMPYQTRSASSHAKTPAAMSPESTEAPFIPKVEQSSSTARPSVTRPPTVPQSSTSQPSTIPPTASPSHMELSPEPMSQSRAIKRPLEQTSQPESKRMSLGEDPSVEHGILVAEDLRWLPKTTITRSTVPTDVLESRCDRKEKASAYSLVHRMKWLRSLLPCHIMKQSRLPKHLQQPWQLWQDKDEERCV